MGYLTTINHISTSGTLTAHRAMYLLLIYSNRGRPAAYYQTEGLGLFNPVYLGWQRAHLPIICLRAEVWGLLGSAGVWGSVDTPFCPTSVCPVPRSRCRVYARLSGWALNGFYKRNEIYGFSWIWWVFDTVYGRWLGLESEKFDLFGVFWDVVFLGVTSRDFTYVWLYFYPFKLSN